MSNSRTKRCRTSFAPMSALFLVAGALSLGTTGCSDDSDATPDAALAASATFVGKTTLTNETSIAVLVGADGSASANTAAVYICDGIATGAWFSGSAKAGQIDATSEAGDTVKAKVEADRVTGQLQLAGKAAVDFTAPRATGIAGIYLVEQTDTAVKGFSATGGKITGTLGAGTPPTVSGTVEPKGGAPVALSGSVKTFGEAAGVSTWVVQPDGSVSGRSTSKSRTGTAGGGNCSAWSGIKSLVFGVDCSFF